MESVDQKRSLHIPLWVILLIAALNGLVYVFLLPPWEQNDEPGQFEYAWLIAQFGQVPNQEEFDQTIRREIASSLIETGFVSRREWLNSTGFNLISLEDKIWIGPEQVGGLPLYYQLISFPLRLVMHTEVVVQVVFLRLLSLIFFLFTVWISALIARELFADQALSTQLPLMIALLPGFVHKMTAINDDVAAVFFYSLFLWLCIRIIRHGASLRTFLGLILVVIACLYVKRTAWSALPFGILALIISLFRRRPVFGWLSVSTLVGLFISFQFQWEKSSPAYFYYMNNQSPSYRVQHPRALAGKYALLMDEGSQDLYQVYSFSTDDDLREKELILGGWVWANQQSSVPAPLLRVNGRDILSSSTIDVGNEPQLFTYSITFPGDPISAMLVVRSAQQSATQVYLDCLFIIESDSEAQRGIPEPGDPTCSTVRWGEKIYHNLVKNASMEIGWPILYPASGEWIDRYFSLSIPNLLAILDKDVGYPYLKATASHLFATFWWRFGWGDATLVGNNMRYLFSIISLLALMGNLLFLWKRRFVADWNIILFFLFATIFTVFMALYRASGNWIQYTFTPVARYFFPVIIPLCIFLTNGWHSWVEFFSRNHQTVHPISKETLTYLILLLMYNVWTGYSIWVYFYRN